MPTLSGGTKLEAALKELAQRVTNASTLQVGILAGATYPDGTSVALVAAVNEFGAPSQGIPPRPAIRAMIAAKSPGWGKGIATQLKANKYDARATLNITGQAIKEQWQQAYNEYDAGPPNSPVTNLLKDRFPMGGQTFADVLKAREDVAAGVTAPAGKPLTQTAHLMNSVDFEVS